MSPHGRWFITGTDTEVGKTVITAALAAGARRAGSVIAAKPIASGCSHDDLERDAATLARHAGHDPCEWRIGEKPLSPHRAVIDPPIDPVALKHWLHSLTADTVLVEGVGGWRVPLRMGCPSVTVRDLASWSDGGVLLVAANRLGVLNHTLLTAEAIQRDGLHLAGVIVNDGAPAGSDDVSRASNLKDLQRLLTVPVIACEAVDLTSHEQTRSTGESLWHRLTCYRSP